MSESILLVGDSYSDPNLYYTTHFLAGDPFIYLNHEGRGRLVVSAMERGRAEKETSTDEVVDYEELDFKELAKQAGSRDKAFPLMLLRLLERVGARKVTVEGSFPVQLADTLRAKGIELNVATDLYVSERRVKSEKEIAAIAEAQQAAEKAVGRMIEMIAASDDRSGVLYLDGTPLTSERLRQEITILLLPLGMALPQGAIIAGGPGAADPHYEGEGPLRTGEAVVMDIFPQSIKTRHWGDITRTVVHGEPNPTLDEMYAVTLRAQQAAFAAIRAGANGKDVNAASDHVFEEAGFAGEGDGPRCTHTVGHGVGLEIHEGPSMGHSDVELRVGDVVTVEPGLYDPTIGAVRIEDTVVVTQEGFRNLTSFPKQFRV
jgi:Xaa-Pro aminopeptidase